MGDDSSWRYCASKEILRRLISFYKSIQLSILEFFNVADAFGWKFDEWREDAVLFVSAPSKDRNSQLRGYENKFDVTRYFFASLQYFDDSCL